MSPSLVTPTPTDDRSTSAPPPPRVEAGGDPGRDAHVMQCMEIWGGNEAIDAAVEMPGLRAWVYSTPYKGEAAGDIHYVSSCATGRITRLLVADVAGHGHKVATLAAKLRDLMRKYVNSLDQSAFVRHLNREFQSVAGLGKFATAIVATYFSSSDCLVASNAGHPRPLCFRAADRSWSILKDKPRHADSSDHAADTPTNLPLGIDDTSAYDQIKLHLQPGDLIIIYTDSLMEAMSPDHRLLGEEGLLDIARSLDPAQPRALISALIDRVIAFSGGRPPPDDVTVLALTSSGTKPARSLRARLGALWEFTLALAWSWRKDAAPVPWPDFSRANLLGAFWDRLGRDWGR